MKRKPDIASRLPLDGTSGIQNAGSNDTGYFNAAGALRSAGIGNRGLNNAGIGNSGQLVTGIAISRLNSSGAFNTGNEQSGFFH